MIKKQRSSFSRFLAVGILFVAQFFLLPGVGLSQDPDAPEALLAAEPGIAADWRSVRVDAQPNFTQLSQHSLKLDASGYASIAFGGDHLYFARFNGSIWTQQAVDGAWGVGSGAALALDGSGKAHISYYDATNQDLKYATNKSGLWVTETVVWSGDVGMYSDIAIDAWGDPSIVYFNETTDELHYINFDHFIPAWVDETIAPAENPNHNGWFSFALDTHVIPNRPHVSYYMYASNSVGELKYAHYNASNVWTSEWIGTCVNPSPTDCKVGEFNSLALDPANYQPAVAFSWHDYDFGALVGFISFNGTVWHNEMVEAGTPSYVSLAYDTVGDTKKARLAWKQSGLRYAYRNAVDDWTDTATVDANASAGEWVSLAVAGATPKVLHYNTSNGILSYVNHDRNGWLAPYTIMTLGHNVGECSSIAVDKLGILHISYFDHSNDFLQYAQFEIGEDPSIMNTIDNSGLTSCFSVIALDPSNNPAVGFIRGGNLYISWLSGAYWLEPLLVAAGVSATDRQGFGMALDTSGYAHFTYRKGGDLWYTYWTGGGWSHNLIVDDTAAAREVALALGPVNTPSIAYYEGTTLNHWTKNVLDIPIIEQIAGSGAGVGAAIAVDPGGKVMAAYLDSIGMNLSFSSRSSVCNGHPFYTCIWTVAGVVDPQGEEYFSLAVDRSGRPHLAATVFSVPMVLHYITRSGTSWVVKTVDSNPSVGWKPAIALSPSGRPRISYYDMFNQDLKVVYQLDSIFLPVVWK